MRQMREMSGFFGGLMQSFSQETKGQDGRVGATKSQSLNDRLATSATGWAAVINGTMDVRTISDGKNTAAINAMHACGFDVMATCTDPDCDCVATVLAQHRPDVKLVRVRVEVYGHD